jgi:hypothetical protein
MGFQAFQTHSKINPYLPQVDPVPGHADKEAEQTQPQGGKVP